MFIILVHQYCRRLVKQPRRCNFDIKIEDSTTSERSVREASRAVHVKLNDISISMHPNRTVLVSLDMHCRSWARIFGEQEPGARFLKILGVILDVTQC